MGAEVRTGVGVVLTCVCVSVSVCVISVGPQPTLKTNARSHPRIHTRKTPARPKIPQKKH